MPAISVIIPTYNRAHLIGETLESVFAQTYTDYEVIVIDDGSTDNTEEVILPLLAEHLQLRYIKQENAGVSAARNHGIFESRGEWIAFLDSDDLWFPDKLEKQMAFLAEHPTAGAVCGRFYQYQNGQVKRDAEGSILLDSCADRTTSVLPFELFATSNVVNTSSVLVRKTILYQAGIFEGGLNFGEDFILWVKIARFTEFWLFYEVVGYVRSHETNAQNNHTDTKFYAGVVRKLQMVRWSAEPHIVKLYEKWLFGHYHYGLANQYRQDKNFKEVANCYWLSMEYAHGWKLKSKTFAKFLLAKFFPLVFWWWDKRQ